MFSYEGLLKILLDKKITKTDLSTELGISSRTIAKIGKGEKLSKRTLRKIVDYLGCVPDSLYREISENAILQDIPHL